MGPGGTRVLVDANILLSRTLRDWLALLYLHSAAGVFEVLWTDDIMAEVRYHLRKRFPLHDDEQIGGVCRRIEATFATGHVTGYAVGADASYVDVDDAHVHCAAIHAGADILLTNNVADFRDLDSLPYEIYTADEFFELVDDSAPRVVRTVAGEQLTYYVQRAKGTPVSLPDSLKRADAPRFAERVRRHLQCIDVGVLLAETPSPT
ncbi:PIN domain-containing protein [Rhodococcus triatomae]